MQSSMRLEVLTQGLNGPPVFLVLNMRSQPQGIVAGTHSCPILPLCPCFTLLPPGCGLHVLHFLGLCWNCLWDLTAE